MKRILLSLFLPLLGSESRESESRAGSSLSSGKPSRPQSRLSRLFSSLSRPSSALTVTPIPKKSSLPAYLGRITCEVNPNTGEKKYFIDGELVNVPALVVERDAFVYEAHSSTTPFVSLEGGPVIAFLEDEAETYMEGGPTSTEIPQ